jgi:hypothetical protein
LTTAARGSRLSVRVGTEECLQTGGHDVVRSHGLIPTSHLSTEPGQVQGV